MGDDVSNNLVECVHTCRMGMANSLRKDCSTANEPSTRYFGASVSLLYGHGSQLEVFCAIQVRISTPSYALTEHVAWQILTSNLDRSAKGSQVQIHIRSPVCLYCSQILRDPVRVPAHLIFAVHVFSCGTWLPNWTFIYVHIIMYGYVSSEIYPQNP